MRFYNNYSVLIGNNGQSNGFYIHSGKFGCCNLLNNKIYDFQTNNDLTEGINDSIQLEIFEINSN